jgi:hypothetical protein
MYILFREEVVQEIFVSALMPNNNTDFTVEEGERIISVIFGDRASEVLKGQWQAIK